MKVTRGLKDLKEVVPYLDKIFRKNFRTLLPKLYSDNTYLDNHYVCRDDNGEFMGALGSIPVVLQVGEDKLESRGIGMVGTRKKFRGKGVMSNMLKIAIADAESEGADYMYLSGIRQRYEPYGFVSTGTACEFIMNKDNIRYTKADTDAYTFEPLTEDSLYMQKVIDIYESQDVKFQRKNFFKTLNSWHIHKNYVVINRDNEVVGHLSYKNTVIHEVCIVNADVCNVIASFLTKKCKLGFVKILIYPNRPDFIKRLSEVCESCNLFNPSHFRIINYKRILQVLLSHKAKTVGGADYSTVIEIRGKCRLKIQKSGDSVSVEDTQDSPEYTFSAEEAAYSIFSPHMSNTLGLPFSTPLYLTTQDAV